MTAQESTDGERKDSIGRTSRRTFLGAAAALAGLSTTATADAAPIDVDAQTDSIGGGIAEVDSGGPVWSHLELFNHGDEEAEIAVSGSWGEDQPPRVELKVNHDAAQLMTSMSTERARRLAKELRLAATHAEQGDLELQEENDA